MNIKKTTQNFLKTRINGAGGDVVLKPPTNTSQMLMSVESFSVIDLLAEGPIGGIVDKNGAYAKGDKLLCGVYIDQVPVRETISQTSYVNHTSLTYVDPTQPNATDLTGVAEFLNSYDDDFQSIYRSFDAGIPDIDKVIASGAFHLNKNLAALIKYSAEEEPILLRGNTAFFSSEDIKYAFIPYTGIDDIRELNLNKNNVSVRVSYSGVNGTGILSNRFIKNSNNDGQFNKMMVSKIPDPIVNLAYGVNSKSTNSSIKSLRGGYVLVPLASGDTLTVHGGQVKFSAVDSNTLDFTSQELENAYLFLESCNEDTSNTYNYDRIDVDVRKGEENQFPLSNVQETSRSYDANFALNGSVNSSSYTDRYDPIVTKRLAPQTANSAYTSSSKTLKEKHDFAAWAKDSFNNYTDDRATYTHIIENPAVTKVSATFTLSALFDTQVTDQNDKAGTQTTALLEMGIELGLEGDRDKKDPLYDTLRQYHKTITFGIEGLVRGSPFRFKVGGGSGPARSSWLGPTRNSLIKDLDNLILPPEIQGRKRYIKIYRITPETFSSKRSISISLSAINEYYGKTFSYPLSAVAGVKIDSRAFARVPSRAYDVRLKKVLIPSNYYPLNNDGTDKRFIKNKNDYDSNNRPKIYNGDWDGTFRYDWTDNPAWILYDMLVDPVYAIGNQLDDLKDINIWQLYEIGRFCDTVNDSGEFVGVNDGYGGLEPRFSCNVMLNNEQEAYDILNSIATVFRGTVFYAGSDIDFYYDIEDEPIDIFNNHNVDGGSFTYSDSLKSSRYTVIEVPYIDKNDNFLQKIEYYEDEESIQRYGYIKHTFQGIGITSRGQAQRFAKYALLSNKLETETVQFTAGREAMMLQPGDIIRIDDELKNLQAVGNYVADVDYDNKRLILPYMPTGGLDTGIYLYCVTGESSLDQLFQEAYEDELTISQDKIDNLNTSKIKNFDVSSYQYTGTSNGGTGLVVNLDTSQSGINKFNDVLVGSFCSIKATGRNEHLYKVVSLSEQGEDKVGVLAAQYEPRKFALVESGIRFSSEEDYFSNLTVDFNSNTPDPPASVTASGGIIISDSVGGIYISGTIVENTTYPLTETYECHLLTPKGNKSVKAIANEASSEQVVFGPFYEFGDYKLSVYGISAAPLKLRSKTATDGTAAGISLTSSAYDRCVIEDINFVKGVGTYEAPIVSYSAEGDFELYQADLNMSWSIRDRMGKVLTTQNAVRNNWDRPKVSIDVRKDDGTYVVKDYVHLSDAVSAIIPKSELNTWFDGSIPRSFEVVLRVVSDSQSTESSGIMNITNPEPEISNLRVSSAYDSISNGFVIWANADKRFRDDIEKISLYTGSTAEETGELFLKLDISQGAALIKKGTILLDNDLYPEIVDNTLLSADSLTDSLFHNEEIVEMISLSAEDDFPTGMSGDTPYELVMGKTFDSLIFLDADRGYATGSTSGINNQSYLNTEAARTTNDAYYPFVRLTGVTSNTDGGTGLLSGTHPKQPPYPHIRQTPNGVDISNPAFSADPSSYPAEEWRWAGSLPGGYVSGKIQGHIGGEKTWNNVWVYFYGGEWAFVNDSSYNLGTNPDADKTETSKIFYLPYSGAAWRLAEEQSPGAGNSMFQQHMKAFSASTWFATFSTKNKQYLFDCGGLSGGWSLYLSGEQTELKPSGSYRLDMRLCDNSGAGTTGELLTVTGGLNVWEIAKWCHIGVSFYTETGAGGNTGHAYVYINGEPHNSGSASGSGINAHYHACGIGCQLGQSVSGAGNNGEASYWKDNPYWGYLADIGIYNAYFSSGEMKQQYFGKRNQYAFKLSTGNNLVQEISGNNTSDLVSLRSMEDNILRIEVSNSSGPDTEQYSVMEKIRNATNMQGVKKQFTLRSEVGSDNDDFTNLVNGTFYLEEVDYLSDSYDWKRIGRPEIGSRFLSTGALGSETPKWGKWIIYSGDDTGNILYEYTGVSEDDPGLLHESGESLASGWVPVSAKMKTGAYGASIGLPSHPLPIISSTNLEDNKTISFADFFLRVKVEDYLGESSQYFPQAGGNNSLPGIRVNFAELGDQGAKTKALQALTAGEQLQNLIEIIGNASAASTEFSGFRAAINDSTAFGGLGSTNLTTSESTAKTITPQITTSLSLKFTIDEVDDPDDPTISVTINATHPDSGATLYFSTNKAAVTAAVPSASLAQDNVYSGTLTRYKVLTVSDGDTVWVTAKSLGKTISDADSETVSIHVIDELEGFLVP